MIQVIFQQFRYEKSGHLIGNEYFLHAYGPIYVLSAEVVASLASARNNSLRMFSNEDVTIGSWMLAMNVYHEDNRAICDPRCTPTSIAVWDIPKCSGLCNPSSRMKELHKIDMCSKSPTLPPDDRQCPISQNLCLHNIDVVIQLFLSRVLGFCRTSIFPQRAIGALVFCHSILHVKTVQPCNALSSSCQIS